VFVPLFSQIAMLTYGKARKWLRSAVGPLVADVCLHANPLWFDENSLLLQVTDEFVARLEGLSDDFPTQLRIFLSIVREVVLERSGSCSHGTFFVAHSLTLT
jgi:hypothetical protein